MVTVVRENGDVHFLNEGEFIRIIFYKKEKQVVGDPIQRTLSVGQPIEPPVITDVLGVTYTNERQPTSLVFQSDRPNECISLSIEKHKNDRLVDTVYPEMDRLEALEVEKQKKEWPNRRYVQKNGNATRFMNSARYHDIETVGDLLKKGRNEVERFKYIGRKCADEVSLALKNLYGIEHW